MDPISILKNRSSCRQFTDEPVSDADLKTILEVAMQAPSCVNEQLWHFIVVKEQETKDKLMAVHPYLIGLKTAPLGIVVCGDLNLEKIKGYWTQDCAAASENILLAAESLGLKGVWCGVFPEMDRVEGFQKALGLSSNIVPMSVIPIGHPKEAPKPAKPRFNAERVHY